EHQTAGQDNERVVDGLLTGRPNDLFDLSLEFVEPVTDSREERGLLGLCRLVSLLLYSGSGFFLLCHKAYFLSRRLLGLTMQSMLFAEAAVLVHLKTVGIVLLVLHGIVVSLLALSAGQRYLNAHNGTSLNCVCARRPDAARGRDCLPLQARPRKIRHK